MYSPWQYIPLCYSVDFFISFIMAIFSSSRAAWNAPECPSCSVLVLASVTRCCTGPSEVELVLQVARAMQCSRRRLRGGGGRGRAPSLRACRARSAFKACTLPGSPWTRASRRHYCHTWSRHMRTFLLQELTLCRGKLSRSRLSFSVCHARGNSANITIELQYFPSDIDNLRGEAAA